MLDKLPNKIKLYHQIKWLHWLWWWRGGRGGGGDNNMIMVTTKNECQLCSIHINNLYYTFTPQVQYVEDKYKVSQKPGTNGVACEQHYDTNHNEATNNTNCIQQDKMGVSH